MQLVLFDDYYKDTACAFFFFQCIYWVSRVLSEAFSTIYRPLSAADKGYWCASTTSSIHAVLLCAFSYHAANASGVWVHWDFFLTSPETYFCCSVFNGYLISDLVLALYFNFSWPGFEMNVIHHLIVIVTLCMELTGGYGHCFAMSAGMTELTTPFVNNRWFMDKMGMKSSTVYVVNGNPCGGGAFNGVSKFNLSLLSFRFDDVARVVCCSSSLFCMGGFKTTRCATSGFVSPTLHTWNSTFVVS